jgi:hypothetical protein
MDRLHHEFLPQESLLGTPSRICSPSIAVLRTTGISVPHGIVGSRGVFHIDPHGFDMGLSLGIKQGKMKGDSNGRN